MTSFKRTLVRIRRTPSAGLLLVQLCSVLLYPFLEQAHGGRGLFGLIGLAVLGAALWVVRRSAWLTGLGAVLALPVAALLLINAVRPDPLLPVFAAALEALFYFYAAGSLIAYMLQDQQATTDELFAAGATFTLLAWAFAYLFVVCQALAPGSFVIAGAAQDQRTWVELLFFSFTILSGVGLGDILPVTPMARALVMVEEFAGVMYLTLVVSRLVGFTIASQRRSD